MRASRSSSEDEEPEKEDASILVRLAVTASGALAPKKMCEGAAISTSQSIRGVLKGSSNCRCLISPSEFRNGSPCGMITCCKACTAAQLQFSRANTAKLPRGAFARHRDERCCSGRQPRVMSSSLVSSVSFLQQFSGYVCVLAKHSSPPPLHLFSSFLWPVYALQTTSNKKRNNRTSR